MYLTLSHGPVWICTNTTGTTLAYPPRRFNGPGRHRCGYCGIFADPEKERWKSGIISESRFIFFCSVTVLARQPVPKKTSTAEVFQDLRVRGVCPKCHSAPRPLPLAPHPSHGRREAHGCLNGTSFGMKLHEPLRSRSGHQRTIWPWGCSKGLCHPWDCTERYGGTGDGAEDGIRRDGIYTVQARSHVRSFIIPQAFPKPSPSPPRNCPGLTFYLACFVCFVARSLFAPWANPVGRVQQLRSSIFQMPFLRNPSPIPHPPILHPPSSILPHPSSTVSSMHLGIATQLLPQQGWWDDRTSCS